MRHSVYVGRELIWVADRPFPQRNLLKFLARERGACRCDFGCWETPLRDQDCGCLACGEVASRRRPPDL